MWYSKSASEVIQDLGSNLSGLTHEETKKRLEKFGPNKLPEQKGKSLVRIFFEQFQSPLIYVLLVADVIVFALQETTDGLIILFILLFNAVLGTIQEGRAQNTLAALTKLVETRAEVLRDGKELNIPDYEVVPGDIILLQEGERVPADARLIEARNLKTEEAALTGESEPVRKTSETITGEKLATAEQKNMIFKGTTVAVGAGKAIAVATGFKTVIGAISEKISAIDTEIPLAKNLRELARSVVIIVAVLIAAIFVTGILEGKNVKEMFVSAVAISVAAVPEGLPLVLTVTLAAGVWRMAKRRVLVKKLQAVESLGQAREIAVDKTGTITKNELTIRKVIIGKYEFNIEGVGYEPKPVIENPSADIKLAATIAAFCSNAHIAFSEDQSSYRLTGDPTEGALLAFAWKAGFPKDKLLQEYQLLNDWPFDYQKKFHLALYEKGNKTLVAITGAPEVIINLAENYLDNGAAKPLNDELKNFFMEKFLKLSGDGLRVIAFAFAENASKSIDQDHLPQFTFGGLFAMYDALRPEIKASVTRAKSLGIKVIMITGDHAVTAKTIASQAGIYEEGDDILTGAEMDSLAPEILKARLLKTTVFARVTPDHKMKVIEDYRRRGEVIAMTGDGVNDAPSLVAADLGIAMGKIGTEVAKEASDIVLLDDNFGDILSAIEEGRNLRQGLRRTITYLFSSNLGEILLIILALIAKMPLPLLAAQLIWMNVVTDTFFDISLALEPKDPSLMKKGARIPKKLFDKFIAARLAVIAPVIALGAFWLFQNQIADPTKARTFALTGLVIFQWLNALNCRSEEKSIFQINPFSNKFLLATLGLVIVLHSFAVYNPFMNSILKIKPLVLNDWLKIAVVAISVIIAEEIRKLWLRLGAKKISVTI
ncbi:MAG TPA: HAD-IC family P-type ATPase [Candidatus Paceibacterota bacterium]